VKHHDVAVERFIARAKQDTEVLAVVVSGSVARGDERPDSDIDLYVVVTERCWAAAFDAQRLMYVDRDDVGYPGGYFDIKLATLSYLDDAAERGDDPVRDSFAHSKIAFSLVPDLQDRIARVAEIPDGRWLEAMASHVAQARLHGGYFLVQGIERDDPMLTAHAAIHLATSASRAMLALNRVPFAGPKYLLSTVADLADKPEGFDEAVSELVVRPSVAAGKRVLDMLEGAADWPLESDGTLSRFILDNELAWRYRTLPPEYR